MQDVFIRKRGSKFYVMLNYIDKGSGKKKQKTLQICEKSREANKILTKYKNEINSNDFIMPKKILIKDYLNEWLKNHKNSISISTYGRYKDIIDRHISKYLGDIELQKLSPLQIETFYNTLLNNLKLSPKTVVQYHRILHKALDKAYKMQLISKNPANLVELPKVKKYHAKVLDIDQVKQLLIAVKGNRIEIPVNLAVALGLRAGEILGLSWDSVNFKDNTITICQNAIKNKETKEVILTQPKSETSIRTLTAPIELMNMLKKFKIKQKELKLRSKGFFDNIYNLVFTQINGKPMASDSFSRLFRDFLKKNKLPLVRFHDLRHTNATLMLTAGTPMKVASTRLGHSTISITADLYTHVLQGLEKEVANKLDNLIYK